MTKEFTQNGITLVFFKKENDNKFSFAIKGDDELTEKILQNTSTHRVKEGDVFFVTKDIFEKLKNNMFSETKEKNQTNPIVELSEFSQKRWGKNIETRVIGKTGPDHNPIITVEVELPYGRIFTASGMNQKLAKQTAAENALLKLK